MKKIFAKFLTMQIIAIIPILVISVYISHLSSNIISENRDKLVRQSMDKIEAAFLKEYADCSSDAYLLLNCSELSKTMMTNSPIDTRAGIELLRDELEHNLDVSIIMAYYGTDNVYSTLGVSSIPVFFNFNSVLPSNLRPYDQIKTEFLSSKESGLRYFPKIDTYDSGYAALSYPLNKNSDTSIHFFFPVNWLLDIFQPVDQSVCCITLSDGNELAIGERENNYYILSEEEKEAWINQGEIQSMVSNTFPINITVTQYYHKYSSDVESWLKSNRVMDWTLIIAGMALSAIISWFFTVKNVREVKRLKQVVDGQTPSGASNNGIFEEIQKEISSQIEEKRILQESIEEQKRNLQNRISGTILGGMYKDFDELENAFRELKFDRCPQMYCIAVLYSEPLVSPQVVEALTSAKLLTKVMVNRIEAIAFLIETDTLDENRLYRNDIAVGIRTEFHNNSIRKVRIGFSPIVTNPMIIESVYSNAARALQTAMLPDSKSFMSFWETMNQQHSGYEVPDHLLKKFDAALEGKNEKEMLHAFHEIQADIPWNCSFPNMMYVRHVTADRFIQQMSKERDNVAESQMIKDSLIGINVENGQEYTRVMHTLIKRYANNGANGQDNTFSKMINYISEHFTDDDLSYEKVAEAGGISKSYLSKLFKMNVNMSYIEYVTKVRINYACKLLRESDMSMAEITKASGFGTESNFRRVFKANVGGCTPAEYRKNEKKLQSM